MRTSLLVLLALPLSAQNFEVASIHLANDTVSPRPLCNDVASGADSTLSAGIYRLDHLLFDAYRDEVADFDLPPSARTDSFAVSVRIPPNTTVAACRKMLQNLLAERFHAVTAIETRDVPHYHVKLARSGSKLKPAAPPSDPSTSSTFSGQDGLTQYTYRGAPMSRIVASLRASASRYASVHEIHFAEVVDETGLTEFYDGQFEYPSSFAALKKDDAESLPDALQSQLGLTLELLKSPGKVLVLRSADRMPTEN